MTPISVQQKWLEVRILADVTTTEENDKSTENLAIRGRVQDLEDYHEVGRCRNWQIWDFVALQNEISGEFETPKAIQRWPNQESPSLHRRWATLKRLSQENPRHGPAWHRCFDILQAPKEHHQSIHDLLRICDSFTQHILGRSGSHLGG